MERTNGKTIIYMPNLTIYTAKNCPFSKRLKDFLYSEEIPFQEIVADSAEKINNLKHISGDTETPVIVLDDGSSSQILHGYTENEKNRLLRFFIDGIK